MNRTKRKANKKGTFKRLAHESLLLSATRFLSSRINGFFSTGFGSPLIASVQRVDHFARNKITGPIFNKIGIRKNFAMPARNAVASFVANNPVVGWFSKLQRAFLNTSLRSLGIFLITFGVYAAAIFLLKSYVSLEIGVSSPDDISVAAVTLAVGLLLLLFGEKSLLSALGNSRITGALLSNCLGVNDSALDRAKKSSATTAVGISFLLGSLCGVLTLFFPPARILFTAFLVLVFAGIINVPEFGLLLTVGTISFLPVGYLAAFSAATLVSFLFKCLILKRNLRFGTADGAMLLTYIVLFVTCLASDGGPDTGEAYLLAFLALYFPVKNLICSEKLIYQTFNALSFGVLNGALLFALGEYSDFIAHPHLRAAAVWLSKYTLSAEMLAVLASAILPFVFCKVPLRKKSDSFFTLMILFACAVITDSFWFYALLLVSVFVYIAFAHKAPLGALLGAGIALPPALVFVSDYTNSTAVSLGVSSSYDSAFLSGGAGINFWGSFFELGGIVAFATFGITLLLVLQRAFSGMLLNSSAVSVSVCGTVAASAVVILACSFVFNPFSDLRVIAVMWFVLGLCGAVYKTAPQIINND